MRGSASRLVRVSAIRLPAARAAAASVVDDPHEAGRVAARGDVQPAVGIAVATQTNGERSMNWRVRSFSRSATFAATSAVGEPTTSRSCSSLTTRPTPVMPARIAAGAAATSSPANQLATIPRSPAASGPHAIPAGSGPTRDNPAVSIDKQTAGDPGGEQAAPAALGPLLRERIAIDEAGIGNMWPVFYDTELFARVVAELAAPLAGLVDKIAGIESRGFVLGAAVAAQLRVGFVGIRKGDGLYPGETLSAFTSADYRGRRHTFRLQRAALGTASASASWTTGSRPAARG